MTYTAVFVEEPDGRISVHVPALRGCHTWGRDMEHALAAAAEAITCHVEGLAAAGDPIPPDLPAVAVELAGDTEARVRRVTVTPDLAATPVA